MKRMLYLIAVMAAALLLCVSASAMSTSFKTVDMSSQKQQESAARLHLQKAKEEVTGESVKNFDINENYVAVCVSEPQAINIYSSTGEWVCSFTFQVNYGDYWVELNKADLEKFNLYIVRDAELNCFDFFGKFVEAAEVDTGAVETTDASSYLHLEKEKSNDHGTYSLGSALGKGTIKLTEEESILTLTDKQGKQTVIYNVNSELMEKNEQIKHTRFLNYIPVVALAVVGTVVSIVAYILVKKRR